LPNGLRQLRAIANFGFGRDLPRAVTDDPKRYDPAGDDSDAGTRKHYQTR
jgi:hypothetical protein